MLAVITKDGVDWKRFKKLSMDEEESSGGALLPSLLDDIEESNVRLGNPEASQQPQPTLQEETQPEANTGRGEDDVASGINVLGSQGVASSPVIELRRTQGIPYIDQDGPIDRMDPGLNRTQGSEAQANYVCRTPPLKRSRSAVVSPESPEQEDVTACPICYEGYTNSGAHRLVSLKCGHVFGQRCVERWLRGTGQRCPSCNSHAKLKDLRVIYVTSLKAIDTAERDRALEQLEKVQEEKRKLELEHTHTRLLCNTLQKENAHLRQKLREQNEKLSRLRQMERIHSKEGLFGVGAGVRPPLTNSSLDLNVEWWNNLMFASPMYQFHS
ncbi:unnamed protein product [Darwinula stevensoni]|uniref:RING-type domain-containing protein n=1 Tax=Darwinula stevensoni TaxID=69355 RepID=A0A7R9ADK1_9CRUS|nr:unnamed protein product [Darwinula stevensoni]CAG0901191.1 unnamed protein product [Darwinula stevensoni]